MYSVEMQEMSESVTDEMSGGETSVPHIFLRRLWLEQRLSTLGCLR